MSTKIWFIPAILVVVGIFMLSTFLAIPIQVEGVEGIDKWQHTFAYFVLSFSFLLAFWKSGKLTTKASWIILILSAAYGLTLEYVQFFFFSYRYFEWFDALANMLGAVLGYILFMLWSRRKSG